MSKPDVNYPPGGFPDLVGQKISGLFLAPPNLGQDFDDIFKVSHCVDCEFENIVVSAGRQRENALDMNRGACRNTFRKLRLDAGKMNAILIKGGSSDNYFEDILITKAGGHSDIYIGDYSDQSKKKSRRNRFVDVRRVDGKPVRVAWNLLRADKPKLVNSKVKYQYALSLVRTFYVELKYLFPKLIP